MVIRHHSHRTKRARYYTVFASDAALLIHRYSALFAPNGARRAHIAAWRVFAVMAGNSRGKGIPFHHLDSREKGLGRKLRAILFLLMCHDAGHLASPAADAFFRIRHDKPVHPSLRATGKKPECPKSTPGCFDPGGGRRQICRICDCFRAYAKAMPAE
jgi:hypothetical protein